MRGAPMRAEAGSQLCSPFAGETVAFEAKPAHTPAAAPAPEEPAPQPHVHWYGMGSSSALLMSTGCGPPGVDGAECNIQRETWSPAAE